MGIDPGASGGIAYVCVHAATAWKIVTEDHDVWHQIAILSEWTRVAVIERVSAMPKQGVSSTFKFGRSAGMLEGFLIAAGFRFGKVAPAKWQKDLKCRSGGNKNVTKIAAQRLWPDLAKSITHATADALLIAEWGRLHADWVQQ